uniref:Uncharacterized protein n=1 Tax=Ananas comosus var. bracteatus TaxID=296719 RepID=A0A6V7PJM2_ANACO|nr:unnamed protein product [Ananas comosus var. bracteatus]
MAENPSIREALERGRRRRTRGSRRPRPWRRRRGGRGRSGSGGGRWRTEEGGWWGWCGGLRGGGRGRGGGGGGPPGEDRARGWYAYAVCSFFVLAVLVPVLFPLIIAQIASSSDSPSTTATTTMRGVSCSAKEMALYQRLVKHSIDVGGSRFSALHWTAISWAAGVIAVAPLLPQVAHQLDRGHHQSLLLIAAITFGAFFCLLTGFFKTAWLFPFYIIFIVSAITVSDSAHSRYLALMLRGLTASSSGRHLSLRRRAAGGQLSLYSTAAGSLGAAVIAAFVYHMLRRSDQLTGLWVVSIFSGLIWFIAICHGLFSNRPASSISSSPPVVAAVAGAQHVRQGIARPSRVQLPARGRQPRRRLPLVVLDDVHLHRRHSVHHRRPMHQARHDPILLDHLLCVPGPVAPRNPRPAAAPPHGRGADAAPGVPPLRVRLRRGVLLQGPEVAGGARHPRRARPEHRGRALHAFGRVLLLDCAPPGKEGAFAAWLAWARAAGAGVGFAVGSASPGRIGAAFGVAFLASLLGAWCSSSGA